MDAAPTRMQVNSARVLLLCYSALLFLVAWYVFHQADAGIVLKSSVAAVAALVALPAFLPGTLPWRLLQYIPLW